MRYVWLPIALGLASCGLGPGGSPEVALLERDRVTVSMSDGWPCVGFRTAETETADGWAGTLEGCPDPFRFEVELGGQPAPRRLVLERTAAAGGGTPQVKVTGANGRTDVFRAPGGAQQRAR